jgi:NAD(P)-dependent dehydrogenase (short-subunit alcohol dehydrogenase family)
MKSILITGASTGIGKACAIAAAQLGFTVYAGHRKDSDGEALKQLHVNIKPTKMDVQSDLDRKSVFDLITKECGHLDCLFNNAGISASGSSEFQSLEKYRGQMEVNFISPVAMTQIFLPLLRKSRDPRILFTGSAAGLLAKPMIASYSASKFALESFVDTLRIELAPWNIKVAIFEPGKIKTEIYKKSLEDAQKENELMSELEKSLYKPLIDVAMYNMENADSMSSEVSEVVKVFIHALTARKPKTRYPVGGDAKMQAIIGKYFPDFLKDWMIKQKLKKFGYK